ncbi:hypothetical protein A3Q56_07480 [Intoshia linei]|uniref:Uncharacterized protein n=1 Tax=Intoshia linei TaxID=1819745 RepID=A0A177ATG6_9BILA|nr:hypothetical protein A3Q56_07480 [Intoshia linei]
MENFNSINLLHKINQNDEKIQNEIRILEKYLNEGNKRINSTQKNDYVIKLLENIKTLIKEVEHYEYLNGGIVLNCNSIVPKIRVYCETSKCIVKILKRRIADYEITSTNSALIDST